MTAPNAAALPPLVREGRRERLLQLPLKRWALALPVCSDRASSALHYDKAARITQPSDTVLSGFAKAL